MGRFSTSSSVLSWITFPGAGAYSAAKSAEWSMTNALRTELGARHIRVSGLHVGYMDTDLTRRDRRPEVRPAAIATHRARPARRWRYEILADDLSKQVMSGLSHGVGALYPGLP